MNALKISRVPLGECVARTNANQTTGMSTRIARRTRREWLFLPLIAGALSGCALVKPAAKAAKLAAPEYGAVIDAVANRLTEKSVDATLEGYVYSRTYRVDGVVREAGAITWVDAWTRTGSADKDDISVSQPTISETQQDDAFAPVPSDVDSALDEIAAALESEKKKAKK